jgi:hypothetical protein
LIHPTTGAEIRKGGGYSMVDKNHIAEAQLKELFRRL